MKKFIIVSDTCCDLDAKLRQEYDIEYIPMHYSYDGKEVEASLDWEYLSAPDFYNLMRNGTRIKTSQVNVEQYKTAFRKYLSEGYDILSISCSSALSSSVKESIIAREELLQEFPDSEIICIDGLNSTLGLGFLCMVASEMRRDGKTIKEVADWVIANRKRINQEATVENLKYLKQAGRVSALSAFFGGMLSVKPIILSDVNGNNVAIEKVKGRQTSLERIVERFKEEYEDVPYQKVGIMHGDCIDDALKLRDMISDMVDPEKVIITYVGPAVGASTGPGTLGLYFFGKEVTFDAKNK